MEINAPLDTVRHFNKAKLINITAIDGNHSYHEFGTIEMAKIAKGRLVITESAKIEEIRAIATNDEFTEIKLAVVGEAQIPEITRDPISLDEITEEGEYSQLILEVQSLNEKGSQTQDSQFVWASVKNEGGSSIKTTEIASSGTVLSEDTKIPAEQQIPAASDAKNTVVLTKVGTFDELKNAIITHKEYIVLLNDISVPSEKTGKLDGLLNINSSLTIDGDGHGVTGYGKRTANSSTIYPTFTINCNNNGLIQSSENIDVSFKNLSITSGISKGRPIETRGKLNSLSLINCTVTATGTGNNQLITLGGSQANKIDVEINNSTLEGTASSYCIISFNQFDATVNDSRFNGYCGFYLNSDTYGSNNCNIVANNSIFNSPNSFSLEGNNSFGVFMMANVSNNIVTLNSCKVNNAQNGTAYQALLGQNSYSCVGNRVIINGNDSYINGLLTLNCIYYEEEEYKDLSSYVQLNGGTYTKDVLNQTSGVVYKGGNYSVVIGEGKTVTASDLFTWIVK